MPRKSASRRSARPASVPSWRTNRSSLGAARSIWVPNDVYDTMKAKARQLSMPVSEIYVRLARLLLRGVVSQEQLRSPQADAGVFNPVAPAAPDAEPETLPPPTG